MDSLDNIIITDIEVIQKNESEWKSSDPIVAKGYGAYSIDTHLMRVGDGSTKWSKLASFVPSTYIGPHAHTHEVSGNDVIKLSNSQLPHTANGTVVFGTGTEESNTPLAGFTLVEAYVCENENEVKQIKEIASDQENIFNNWTRYSHATLGDHYNDSGTLIYTCTDEDKGWEQETTEWSYDSVNKIIRNTTNSYTVIGMVSPDKYSDYELEATMIVDPDDFDDDSMGLVLASVTDSDGKNHTLSVYRSIGGNIPYNFWHNRGKTNSFEILRNHKTVKYGTGFYGSSQTEAKFWTSSGDTGNRRLRHYLFRKGVKINTTRKGNVFTILTSNFANDGGYVVAEKYTYPGTTDVLENVRFECASDTDLLEETKIVLDLDANTVSYYEVTYNDDKTAIVSKTWTTTNLTASRAEALSVYKNPGSIGYTCCSQKNTTWNNIKFLSSNSKIYNLSTNEVEEQQADGSWSVNANTSIYEEIKPGRFAFNPYTSKLFYIKDEEVKLLSNNDLDYIFTEFLSKMNVKTTITEDKDFYVATTGNDTTGDGSSLNPWKTIQHAVDVAVTNYSIGHKKITIHVAAGEYSEYVQLPEIETHGIAGTMAGTSEGVAVIEGAGDSTILNIGPAVISAGSSSTVPQYIGMLNAGNWLVKDIKVQGTLPDKSTAFMAFVSSYGKLFLQNVHCVINNNASRTQAGAINFGHADVSGILFILSGCTFTYNNNGVASDSVTALFGADLSQIYMYGDFDININASTPKSCAAISMVRGSYCIQNYNITGSCNGYARNASTGGMCFYSSSKTCVGSLGDAGHDNGIVTTNIEFPA